MGLFNRAFSATTANWQVWKNYFFGKNDDTFFGTAAKAFGAGSVAFAAGSEMTIGDNLVEDTAGTAHIIEGRRTGKETTAAGTLGAGAAAVALEKTAGLGLPAGLAAAATIGAASEHIGSDGKDATKDDATQDGDNIGSKILGGIRKHEALFGALGGLLVGVLSGKGIGTALLETALGAVVGEIASLFDPKSSTPNPLGPVLAAITK